MVYLHPDVYQKRSQEIHPILAKRMEQLRIMDLTRHDAEGNMEHMQLLRKERHDRPRRKTPCKHRNHGMIKPPRKEAKKHKIIREETMQAMEEIKHSLDKGELEQIPESKTRFYPSQRILWHLRHKIPRPGKFKIRWAGPYLIKQVYDNGSVDVTTLQGESLGRVNMNKLKPYHEPETTRAYALQIIACHLLEAEMKANQHQFKDDTIITHPQPKGKPTSPTESTPYQEDETLEAQDLEIHQVMLESYWAQPSPLKITSLKHTRSEEINSPKGNNASLNHPCNTFDNSTYVHIEFPEEDANLTYPTHLAVEKGRTDHLSK